MNNYPFYYEVRIKLSRYDFKNSLHEKSVSLAPKLFKDRTPLENRENAIRWFKESLSTYLEPIDRLSKNKQGNYIIKQPPFIASELNEIENKSNFSEWIDLYDKYKEEVAIYLIIEDEKTAEDIAMHRKGSSLDKIINKFETFKIIVEKEFLIHKIASYDYEEQDIVDNLEFVELYLYNKYSINISNNINTVYHFGLDYSESGETSDASYTILRTPHIWQNIDYYNEYWGNNSINEETQESDIGNIKKDAKTLNIKDGQIGVSYKLLFAKYLEKATEITIEDPYIQKSHQIHNLIDFIQLVIQLKNSEDNIRIHLITWYTEDYKQFSINYFDGIRLFVRKFGIDFTYEFEKLHDRKILTNTGWTISLGRGLDIYSNECRGSNFFDQELRQCKKCTIIYLFSSNSIH